MEARTDTGGELVIGLVAPIGVDLSLVSAALGKAFHTVEYQTQEVRLIELLPDSEVASSSTLPLDQRYRARMSAGNRFRQTLGRSDALALMALAGIRKVRKAVNGNPDHRIKRCAYILRSLKTKEEVERLRKIYGSSCYIVAAYAPRDHRRKWLAARIAESQHSSSRDLHLSAAEDLIQLDEHERIPQGQPGQNVRDTFPFGRRLSRRHRAQPPRRARASLRGATLWPSLPYSDPR